MFDQLWGCQEPITDVLEGTSLNEHPFEEALSRRTIRVYDLNTDVVRCDATTGSGSHTVTESGVFQFGHSKDDPRLAHITLMSGARDPLGMPLATDVVSGEQADDGLYWPIIT